MPTTVTVTTTTTPPTQTPPTPPPTLYGSPLPTPLASCSSSDRDIAGAGAGVGAGGGGAGVGVGVVGRQYVTLVDLEPSGKEGSGVREGGVRKEHGGKESGGREGGGRNGRDTYVALLARWCFHTSGPGAGAGDDATPVPQAQQGDRHSQTHYFTTPRNALPSSCRRLGVRGLRLNIDITPPTVKLNTPHRLPRRHARVLRAAS
ncbi:hypothetical protein K439DRAFT_411208 [Ramaria rubella]|nr:hypothetical protein K439DRAFT_411208 [Ramaria rubella]